MEDRPSKGEGEKADAAKDRRPDVDRFLPELVVDEENELNREFAGMEIGIDRMAAGEGVGTVGIVDPVRVVLKRVGVSREEVIENRNRQSKQ